MQIHNAFDTLSVNNADLYAPLCLSMAGRVHYLDSSQQWHVNYPERLGGLLLWSSNDCAGNSSFSFAPDEWWLMPDGSVIEFNASRTDVVPPSAAIRRLAEQAKEPGPVVCWDHGCVPGRPETERVIYGVTRRCETTFLVCWPGLGELSIMDFDEARHELGFED